ncbi:MAG: hypothetical protein ACYC9Y_10650 [Candidatus Methylomirabilia bacterium]
MRRFRPFRRVEIVVAGVAVLFFLGAAGVSRAGVVDSKHDFTKSNGKPLDKGGVCTPCHTPHYSPEARGIWARDLGDERNYFNQISSPDYVPGTTLLCYDCHDDNATTGTAAVDNDPPNGTPPLGSWNSDFEPQDIAFGYSYNPVSPYNLIPDDTLAQGGSKTGYYELVNGDVPGGPTPMPATTPVPAAPTGGHYWKQDPSGTPDNYTSGDKIPCSLCHDPHNVRTGTNEAFFLTETTFAGGTVTLGNGLRASNKDDTTNLNRSRNGTGPLGTGNGNGREMCVACHSFSNSGSPVSIGGRTLPKPPLTISQHRSSNGTACTKCHPHNKVQASCNDCHGFPPLRTFAEAGNNYFDRTNYPDAENYPGGAGAHQRHKDALGDTIFQCEICHGPDPGSAAWHNEGGGVIADGSNVNIMGLDTYWSPPGYPGSLTPAYDNDSDRVPDPGDTAYVFSSKGGGQRVCSGVACHGNPPPSGANVLNWDDDMIDGDVPDPAKAGEIQICKWCHDATPAMIFVGTDPFDTGQKSTPSNYAYGANAMGNGLATGFGAEVNGHGVGLSGAVKAVYDKDAVNDAAGAAGAAKECTVCHDATYIAAPPPNHPQRTHFPAIFGAASDPRDAKRLRDSINSGSANIGTSATFQTGPDQACLACHQNGVNTVADGLDVSHHGIPPQPPPAGGYVPSEGDPAFTRSCRQCHEVHGSNWNGAGRNLYMVGKWVDVNGDRTPNAGDGAYVDSNAMTPLANITSGGGPANDNAVVFTATTGADSFDENDGAYDASGVADRDDICATCHAPAPQPKTGAGTAGGTHDGTLNFGADMRGQNCMQCHDHDYDNIYATVDAFMPSGCEGCHGPPFSLCNPNSYQNPGCDGTAGTVDDAPNVMGDGCSPTGTGGATPKPFDDGTFGYNVNGHGADGTAANNPIGLNPNRSCPECHDISNPPGTHFNCAVPLAQRHNTKYYFGKTTDTRSANTSHLVAGFLAGANNPQAKQIAFDGDVALGVPTSSGGCYNNAAGCHYANGVMDMRHGTKVAGVYDNIMQFNIANDTTDDPKQDRGADNVWTPWTIDDLTNVVDASPPTVRHHGVCVSCHDPHGTAATQKTRNTNKMVIRNWKGTSMQPFCGSNCHKIP